MAKTLKETAIAGRGDRKRLDPADKPYWRSLDPDVHIGYLRRTRGGLWKVRMRRSDGGYRQETVGTADDEIGEGTLDYNAAVRIARQRVEGWRREEQAVAAGPRLTVRSAVEEYIVDRDARESAAAGRPKGSDAHRLEIYVIGREARGHAPAIAATDLADIPLDDLKETDLVAWLKALPSSLADTSVTRLVNNLKAALNAASEMHRSRLPVSFGTVIKQGLRQKNTGRRHAPRPRREQILTLPQLNRVLAAAATIDVNDGWDRDLLRLITVMAATGLRYSQVIRLQVRDVQTDRSTLQVPVSNKGKGKEGHTPVQVSEAVIELLRPTLAGKRPTDILLARKNVVREEGSIKWRDAGRREWRASELARPWSKIVQMAGLPEITPYAFRDTRIVRAIGENIPLRLIAAIHDTSVAMIEKHYSRHIVDGLNELAAKAVVPLTVPSDTGSI